MSIFQDRKRYPVIDLTFLPHNGEKIRGQRDEKSVNMVVAHVTAVRGGFGPGTNRMRKWQKILDSARDSIQSSLLKQLDPFPAQYHAMLLALWERYSHLPYHWMVVPAIKPHIIRNIFPSVYSYHAGIGNKHSVGWAIDCQYDEDLTDDMIKAGQESLRRCIQDVRSVCRDTVYVQAHRNFSDQRINDPGPNVWSKIVEPVVASLPYAEIRYDLAEGSGKQIPEDWQ